VSPETGEIFVSGCSSDGPTENNESCLDFESQKSYVLTYTGTDGGGQVDFLSKIKKVKIFYNHTFKNLRFQL